MKIEVYDEKKRTCLYIADVWFGLDVLIVREFTKLRDDLSISSVGDFTRFLQSRAEFRDSYEIDDIVLKKLNLYDKKYEFGRMSEACVLYAMLCNFKKKEDAIAIYPLQTELVSMIAYDPSYSNIYFWEKRNADEIYFNA